MAHKYTDEQQKFIFKNVTGITSDELTEKFNQYFNKGLKVSQIRAYKKNHKLSSGINSRFKKGSIPSNKGTKGLTGPNKTSFKKGNKPANWVPIGTERVNGDGYIDIKVQDGKGRRNWKGKHIIIWEKHNGPVPKGYAVIFGDKNNRNFDISNLIMVSRQQLAILNKHGLIQKDADLTRTGVIIADITSKISNKKAY